MSHLLLSAACWLEWSALAPGVGGRTADHPRGCRNRLAEDFVAALYDDFQDHGSAAIAACRAEQPAVYLKVIASLLPKDVTLTTRNFDDLSDDQLMRKLALVTEMAKPLLAKLPTLIDVTVGTPVEPRADVGAQASNDINILATDDN